MCCFGRNRCWNKLLVLLIKIILVVSYSVRSYIVPFFFYPLSIFVLGCQCARAFFQPKSKNTPELTLIDN